MQETEFVAVTHQVDRAGTIVMWSMRGETQLLSLHREWMAAGLDVGLLPFEPTSATALRRAVTELREAGRIVHPLGRRGNGFAVVEVKYSEAGEELSFETVCKAKLDKVERLIVSGNPKLCTAISNLHAHHLGSLEPIDISTWLIGIIEDQLDGVSMRSSGGVYFVPATKLDQLGLVIEALRKAAPQHSIYKIPCMRGEDAVQAILDSIAAETEASLAEMASELEEGLLGTQAWENRVRKCGVLESKVARYEGLLGANLDKLRDRLDGVRAELTVAMVKVDLESQDDDGA